MAFQAIPGASRRALGLRRRVIGVAVTAVLCALVSFRRGGLSLVYSSALAARHGVVLRFPSPLLSIQTPPEPHLQQAQPEGASADHADGIVRIAAGSAAAAMLEELDELHQIFDTLDRDGNGLVDLAEFTEGLSMIGGALVLLSSAEQLHIFRAADKTGSGSVDFNQFAAWVLTTKEFVAYFLQADRDCDGIIHLDEWRFAATKMYPEWTAEQVDDAFRVADSNGTGGINFVKLVNWLNGPEQGVAVWVARSSRPAISQ